MTFLFYSLTLFGVAYIVGHSAISLPLRQALSDRSEVCVRCPTCQEWVPRRRWTSTEEQRGVILCPECYSGQVEVPDVMRSGFRPLKWPVLLLECPACLGTWVGFVVACIYDAGQLAPHFGHPVVFACLSAGINSTLGHMTGLMRSGEHAKQ